MRPQQAQPFSDSPQLVFQTVESVHKVILSYAACGKKSHLLSLVNPRNSLDYADDQTQPARAGFKGKHLFHAAFIYISTYEKHNLQLINQGQAALCKMNSEEL